MRRIALWYHRGLRKRRRTVRYTVAGTAGRSSSAGGGARRRGKPGRPWPGIDERPGANDNGRSRGDRLDRAAALGGAATPHDARGDLSDSEGLTKTTNRASAPCSIFGRGQGGSVDLNLQRWRDQFETDTGGPPSLAERKSTINGLAVTTVSLAGTYLASMGPMFQSGTVKKPGYRMLGAIVEAPEGNVFVKLTGPEKTVLGADGEFQAFLNSLRK